MNSFILKYLIPKIVISVEESLTDLPTPNLPGTPTSELRKSNLLQKNICNVISDITSILETVHYDMQN